MATMLPAPRVVYMLVKYAPMGTLASIQLGGGSSTSPKPRVYDNRKLAERYAKQLGADIIEVRI